MNGLGGPMPVVVRDGLVLLSGASHHFVSSSMANQPSLRAKAGEPFLEISPSDAAARGIADGDRVVVENERGWCELRAVVTADAPAGVPRIHRYLLDVHHSVHPLGDQVGDRLTGLVREDPGAAVALVGQQLGGGQGLVAGHLVHADAREQSAGGDLDLLEAADLLHPSRSDHDSPTPADTAGHVVPRVRPGVPATENT